GILARRAGGTEGDTNLQWRYVGAKKVWRDGLNPPRVRFSGQGDGAGDLAKLGARQAHLHRRRRTRRRLDLLAPPGAHSAINLIVQRAGGGEIRRGDLSGGCSSKQRVGRRVILPL